MAWKMNSKDVSYSPTMAGSSTATKKRNFERKLKLSQRIMQITHLPTGVSISEEIPKGHYSKKEMRKAEDVLYQKLYPLLEKKVAKHLRLPGN
jgi:hypothetical protein